jgi:hypothetical protein
LQASLFTLTISLAEIPHHIPVQLQGQSWDYFPAQKIIDGIFRQKEEARSHFQTTHPGIFYADKIENYYLFTGDYIVMLFIFPAINKRHFQAAWLSDSKNRWRRLIPC